LKSAIISGASGFVGKYLSAELEKYGVEVTKLRRGEFPSKSADVFYHLAWECATGTGRGDPFIQLKNVELTLKLLSEAHKCGCKKFVSLGTIYEKLSLPEKAGSADFYVLAKRYAHETADRLALKLGIDFVWTTVCHPVGTGIKPEQMAAFVVKSLLDNESPNMGPAKTWYDIVAVGDLARGLRLIGESELSRREYFIGSGKPRILCDYLSEIPQILGTETAVNIGARADDGLRFEPEWFDISPLEKDTGFTPQITFGDAILSIAEGFSK
jgi:nucleoside-diphosphate-sugar epimerase